MSNNQEIHYLGRVLDREKQAPISGAKVSIHLPGFSRVVYSDLEGIYKFPISFGNSRVLEGEITIEVKGYKTYSSFIKLLPNERDLGDIQLVPPHFQLISPHVQETENNDNLLPVIAALMVVLALIVAVLTLPPPQETPPLERPDTRINLLQPFNVSKKSVSEVLYPSISFQKHEYKIASFFEFERG
ncbi:hypothetical protein BZZ01_04120 [Nostocales cyanobacterium HT-58-2]|nr:hypothetical protein BZZ01_04120 [Nostocales cyanobacterium HT-58-2]